MPADDHFEQALEALLDGRHLGKSFAADAASLPAAEPLLVLDAIARAHRLVMFGKEFDTETAPLRRWGHLEVGEELGRGATGTVHRAWDTRLNRELALKLLAPDTGAHETQALTEGRLLARLRHPHIVTVFDADTHDDVAGISMELVQGDTLDHVLERDGVFGVEEALLVGIDLAAALAAVHAAGLLHRDIKARNVVRERGGRVVLMDLGAGRPQEETPAGGDGTGTPLYMAPEVLAGGAATERSDVYGLGVLLYRLLTGTFPVTASGLDDLRSAHASGRHTPLARQNPDLPHAVLDAIDQACDPDPPRRFAGAAEFERALRHALADALGARARVRSGGARAWARWRQRTFAAAAAVLAVLAGTSAGWNTNPGRAARRALGMAVPPRSPLYLSIAGGIVIVNGQRVAVATGNPAMAFAIAVSSDLGVRTMGGFPPWTGGAAFTIDGAPLPVRRASIEGVCCFYDGTTDGRFNYSVRQDSTLLEPIGSRPLAPATIYRFARDWSEPEPLFSLTQKGSYSGLTYSGQSGTFWMTRNEPETAVIEEWSRDGRLVSVPVRATPPLTGIAADPGDGTLWVMRQLQSNDVIRLENFGASGRHLGTFDVARTLPLLDAGGAEFAWPDRP